MGSYNHFLSLDAAIMVLKNCPIFGERVIIFLAGHTVAMATYYVTKMTTTFSPIIWLCLIP